MRNTRNLLGILFDCDGTLVETERDGHRVAFNDAFRASGIEVVWDIGLYGELLKIGGGKERLRHFFNERGWPQDQDPDQLVLELHRLKTDRFMELTRNGRLPLRPGVVRLVDEAVAQGIKIAVCSTSNEKAVRTVIEATLGSDRMKKFTGIFAGDIVAEKKPSPEIYNLAVEKLNLNRSGMIVIEDTRVGLLAAKGAELKCVITPSLYSRGEDFSEADLVAENLNAEGGIGVEKLLAVLSSASNQAK